MRARKEEFECRRLEKQLECSAATLQSERQTFDKTRKDLVGELAGANEKLARMDKEVKEGGYYLAEAQQTITEKSKEVAQMAITLKEAESKMSEMADQMQS